MGHTGLKTSQNDCWETAEVFIQHHRAVQLHSTCSPKFHQGPRLLVWIASGLRKSSQQNQTTQCCLIFVVQLDSVLMYLFVCAKKLNFLSWAIQPVFTDPVTFYAQFIKQYLNSAGWECTWRNRPQFTSYYCSSGSQISSHIGTKYRLYTVDILHSINATTYFKGNLWPAQSTCLSLLVVSLAQLPLVPIALSKDYTPGLDISTGHW